ncbi:MAG TPA: hypothetical protein VJB06_04065 [archaeon]|nr:hypothetical protein [archaeon]
MSTFFYRDGGRVFVSLEETKDRRQDLLGAVPYRPNFLNGDDVGSYPTGDVFKELNRRRDELVSAFIEGRATKDTGLELYAVDRLVSLLRT